MGRTNEPPWTTTESFQLFVESRILNVVTPEGVCTCIIGAGGSVSVYLQHCEPELVCWSRD